MHRKTIANTALSATIAICTLFSSSTNAAECTGVWSASGKQPRVGDAYTADSIASPDKKLNVSVSDESVEMLRQNGGAVGLNVHANSAFMEIVWSADSGWFSINVSEAANEGPWLTFAYVVENESPKVFSLYDVKNAASSLPRCDVKTNPNLATLAWLDNGRELLIGAEVPPLSSCKNKNEVAGFRVSTATGKVLERLTGEALKQKFGKELGCRLR